MLPLLTDYLKRLDLVYADLRRALTDLVGFDGLAGNGDIGTPGG